MPTPIEQLFKPTSAPLYELLADFVEGFAIPAYQRPYRWDPTQLKRLLAAFVDGLERLNNEPDAVVFIGALITVAGDSDAHHVQALNPIQVIDGQQRLTTLMLIFAAVHEHLVNFPRRLKAFKPEGDQQEAAVAWLLDAGDDLKANLRNCLVETRNTGDDGFKELPKVIREIADTWSNRAGKATYRSPVASFLHAYANESRIADPGKLFTFKPTTPSLDQLPEATGSSNDDHLLLHNRWEQVRTFVKLIATGKSDLDIEAIDLSHALRSKSQVMAGLFDRKASDTYAESLLAICADETVANAVRLLLFGRFVLSRVALTQINASDEAYAFELFDALNTTGEPLTAVETFIPLIVQAEHASSTLAYEKSPSYQDVAVTTKLLAAERGDTQRHSARLVTSFLLADAGMKVPTRLNDQRRQLGKWYQGAPSIADKRAITSQLAATALTYLRLWDTGELIISVYEKPEHVLGSEARTCLAFLKGINHTVAVAPLSRYFASYRAAPSLERAKALDSAIRAITAFSVLWRGAHGGTAGIDERYRVLMRAGGSSGKMTGLARTAGEGTQGPYHELPLPPVSDLRAALLHELANAKTATVASQGDWLRQISARPVYEQAQLAKFLLLLASHHAVPDGTTGLTKDGMKADDTDMLRPDRWGDDKFATVEHVAPQKPEIAGPYKAWSDNLYSDASIIHRLGNLTLVPVGDNSALGNRSWTEKRFIYRALSAQSKDDAEKVIALAAGEGVTLPQEYCEVILRERRHLPVLRAVADYEGDWNADFVAARTEDLAKRAWSVLGDWLEG